MRYILPLFVLMITTLTVSAQDNACSTLVQEAVDATHTNCTNIGRNQACYGNVKIDTVPSSPDIDLAFDQSGDIVDVVEIQSMQLSSMLTPDEWGIALLSLQANLPDTLPGQNVLIVLFGDVTIENAASLGSDYDPMQSFILTSGIGEPRCTEAPRDGILIQTPEGVGMVDLQINGVQISLGSTAFLQAVPDDNLVIALLEGQSTIMVNDSSTRIPLGAQAIVPIDSNGIVDGEPSLEPLNPDNLTGLPIEVLPREIEIAEPIVINSPQEGEYAFPSREEYRIEDCPDETYVNNLSANTQTVTLEDNGFTIRITHSSGSSYTAGLVAQDVYQTGLLGGRLISTFTVVSSDEILWGSEACGVTMTPVPMTYTAPLP